ncbi:O-antigen ligase family protein [Aliifodinibius salicampi]|uniref:O-antigen ligase family protein n=1 Tax=Fodinibius salicampi TaxID=1920655 RepID=A0ABT3PV80_9BACT|nr:O-antigen ligase family protein [Fodinibius salicampi]MCW9711764.1 O-antigen ligase family protein [Fodinibius salicampi]
MKYLFGEGVLLVIVGILICLPTLQYEPYGIDHLYNTKRLFEIGLLGLIGSVLLFSTNSRIQTASFIQFYSIKFRLFLMAIFLIGAVSCFFSLHKEWALLDYSHYLLLSTTIFFVASITYKDINKAVLYLKVAVIGFVFFYSCRVLIFYFLSQVGSIPLWPGSVNGKALYSFSYIRFFNQTQTWTIPILISLSWYGWNSIKKDWLRWGSVILTIWWGALVFASGARGTILSIVVSFFIMFGLFVKNKSSFLRHNSLIVAFTLICYYIFFKILGSSTSLSVLRTDSSGRIDHWIDLIHGMLEKPLLGYGPMHYASVELNKSWGHPHNWFLQFGYEWGIIVALILLGIFIFGLYKFGSQLKVNLKTENYTQERYWIKFGLLWSMIAAFIHGFLSGIIVMPLSQVWLILIVGVSMGLYIEERETGKTLLKSKGDRVTANIVASLVIISFIGFLSWSMKHPIDRGKADSLFYKKSESSKSYPRFWQQGKIGWEKDEPGKREVEIDN